MYKVTDKSCFHNGENSNTSLFVIDNTSGSQKTQNILKSWNKWSYEEQVILFITVNCLVPSPRPAPKS